MHSRLTRVCDKTANGHEFYASVMCRARDACEPSLLERVLEICYQIMNTKVVSLLYELYYCINFSPRIGLPFDGITDNLLTI